MPLSNSHRFQKSPEMGLLQLLLSNGVKVLNTFKADGQMCNAAHDEPEIGWNLIQNAAVGNQLCNQPL